jgi:hypothetical protein
LLSNLVLRRYKKVEEEDDFADLVNTNSTVEVVAQGDANMRTLKVGRGMFNLAQSSNNQTFSRGSV